MGDTGNMIKAMAISGLAAFLAYAVNRLMVARCGEWAIKFLVPIIEEGLKTGLSLGFAVSIPAIHSLFGIYEAGYDLAANPGARPQEKWLAALAACVGHGVFGGVTWLLLARGLGAVSSIGMVGILHGLWNALALH